MRLIVVSFTEGYKAILILAPIVPAKGLIGASQELAALRFYTGLAIRPASCWDSRVVNARQLEQNLNTEG